MDTDAQAYIDAVVADGGSVNEFAVDELVKSLKSAGVWSKLSFLHMLNKTASTQDMRKCLKRLTNGTSVGAAYDPDEGLTGDGTDDYFRTLFYPSVDGGSIWEQNSAHFMLDVKEGNPIGQNEGIGNSTTRINAYSTGNIRYNVNVNNADDAGSGPSDGVLIANRVNGTEHQIAREGTILATNPQNSGALRNSEILGLARNVNDAGGLSVEAFSDVTLRAIGGGAGLTAQEISDYTDAIKQYYIDADGEPVEDEYGPFLIDGQPESGIVVEHLAYDDKLGAGEVFLERLLTEPDGTVTTTESLPEGKIRAFLAYKANDRDNAKLIFP